MILQPRLLPAFCGGMTPTPVQRAFLCANNLEAFLAGSSGIGKSIGICFGALEYVDQRDYRALILRPRLSDYARTDTIQSTLDKMLRGSGASYSVENFVWSFPSGAKLTLAFAKKIEDVGLIQGASFQYIGYDELPLFPEDVYTWSFSRCRAAVGLGVPLRIRGSATPPEDASGAWFTDRFISARPKGCTVIAATTEDNPHLSKSQLAVWDAVKDRNPAVYQRQFKANWFYRADGTAFFNAAEFPIITNAPASYDVLCRGWDLAGTDKDEKDRSGRKAKDRADYTAGILTGWNKKIGMHTILDCVYGQWSVSEVDRRIQQTAERDGKEVLIALEQQPGVAGKIALKHFRELLAGYHIVPIPARASKTARAVETQRYGQEGLVCLAYNPRWNSWLREQILGFPTVRFDDGVDGLVTSIAGIHARNVVDRELI